MVKSFDRVADIYDSTRHVPPDVLDRIMEKIMTVLHPADGTVLEIGIGTGRIAVPMAKRGFRVVGVDVSEKMLNQLREKIANTPLSIRVVRGDVTILPFADDSFKAALAVHVFHLLDDVRSCVAEVRRVMSPGGCLFFSGVRRTHSDIQRALTERYGVKENLDEIFTELGLQPRNRADVEQRVLEAVAELGGSISRLEPVEWDAEMTCDGIVSRIEGRVTSSLWNVPDETLSMLVEKVRSLLTQYVGSPSTVIPMKHRFEILCARFE